MSNLKKPIWCKRLHFLLDIFGVIYYLMSDISDIIWYIWCQWCLILQKLDKFLDLSPKKLIYMIPMMSDIIWYIWCHILFDVKDTIYYLIPKVANISDFALKTWLFLFNFLIFFLNRELPSLLRSGSFSLHRTVARRGYYRDRISVPARGLSTSVIDSSCR